MTTVLVILGFVVYLVGGAVTAGLMQRFGHRPEDIDDVIVIAIWPLTAVLFGIAWPLGKLANWIGGGR